MILTLDSCSNFVDKVIHKLPTLIKPGTPSADYAFAAALGFCIVVKAAIEVWKEEEN
jgi:hypothetical protein